MTLYDGFWAPLDILSENVSGSSCFVFQNCKVQQSNARFISRVQNVKICSFHL
jgi:hypothetical protein